jgi:hypothetical protein
MVGENFGTGVTIPAVVTTPISSADNARAHTATSSTLPPKKRSSAPLRLRAPTVTWSMIPLLAVFGV